MGLAKGFCDLSINYDTQEDIVQVILQALKLGYQTIALNVEVSDDLVDSSTKKKDLGNRIPPPPRVEISKEELTSNGIRRQPIFLSRITISYTNPGSVFIHTAKDAILLYDLVAFMPRDENSFKHLVCKTNFDFDIIKLDIHRNEFRPSKKLIKLAISKNIFFELSYSPLIEGSNLRERTIKHAHTYFQACRGKHLIITSNASSALYIRNPNDVANLGRLFGVTDPAAKAAVSTLCWQVVECAEHRRSGAAKCSAEITVVENGAKRTKFSSIVELRDSFENT